MRNEASKSDTFSRTKNMTAIPGKRTARRLNPAEYGRLLVKALPTVPKDAKTYRRLKAIASALMDKAELTPEERALLELTVALVSEYENQLYDNMDKPKPYEMLAFLMEEHGLRQRDLLDIFPTRSLISEVLSGKRLITKDQAVALARRFGTKQSLFLEP
ncbi:MAG TPA: transcriptional regulator [Blastocatellia bacterium]